jgi:hypothetical protein
MNCFDGYTRPVVGGHHAMLRFAEDGQAEPVLGDGGKPVIFPNELEAQKAVTLHLLRFMNGRYRREGEVAGRVKEQAERIFRKGKMILVERRAT